MPQSVPATPAAYKGDQIRLQMAFSYNLPPAKPKCLQKCKLAFRCPPAVLAILAFFTLDADSPGHRGLSRCFRV